MPRKTHVPSAMSPEFGKSSYHLRGKNCKETGKRSYRTALDCLLEHQRNPRQIRAYECAFCGNFHATSQPSRKGD